MTDMIHNIEVFKQAPPALIDSIRSALDEDGSYYVRIYHHPDGLRWTPVVFSDDDDVKRFEREAKKALKEGWVFVATLTEPTRQTADYS